MTHRQMLKIFTTIQVKHRSVKNNNIDLPNNSSSCREVTVNVELYKWTSCFTERSPFKIKLDTREWYWMITESSETHRKVINNHDTRTRRLIDFNSYLEVVVEASLFARASIVSKPCPCFADGNQCWCLNRVPPVISLAQ